jgi:hypothetical protein
VRRARPLPGANASRSSLRDLLARYKRDRGGIIFVMAEHRISSAIDNRQACDHRMMDPSRHAGAREQTACCYHPRVSSNTVGTRETNVKPDILF